MELAELGLGRVSPNPLVGCVIVHKDRILGEGYHHQFGGPHAEVNAIQAVPPEQHDLLPHSTLYVNLEPCAHQGKTPPCADLILSMGIPEVIIGTEDPNPAVAGKGIQRLRDAGCQVVTDVLGDECRHLNRRFFSFHLKQRPYVMLKWASSADGYLAPPDHGPEQRENWWLTGPPARVLAHKWRSEEDAILVGTNTVIADDPALTTREWSGRNPLRIVIDRHLQLPGTHRCFSPEARTLVLNEHRDEEREHLMLRKIRMDHHLIPDLFALLTKLRLQSLIVEGGASLLKQFIDADLWDEARVFISPVIMERGIPAPGLGVPPLHSSAIGSDRLFMYSNRNE